MYYLFAFNLSFDIYYTKQILNLLFIKTMTQYIIVLIIY